ncbi:hypothetical protein [Sphingopyxis sp.]|uniref:hypothetical protein n=1 Tax=Sphingopyxis sp. TaxID=1908224 RepID=UPI001D4D4761|nr:hypothetical protein [Sphingopyxis sp.]MBW8296080.1 hypothetical protein [Sphingopyxis sp.]
MLPFEADLAATTANDRMEAGVLIERTGYRRNRVYAAEAVLAIVNRPFGAAPEFLNVQLPLRV